MTPPAERHNPYVGPRSFKIGELLYGRDREKRDLLDLLIAQRIVLLHSPSGAGKSSLINAGLIQNLQEERFRVLPVARVHLDPRTALGAEDLEAVTTRAEGSFNRYIFSVLLSFEENLPPEQRRPLAELACSSLEEYLTCCPGVEDEPEDIVLIFDQFEEIITAHPTDREGKRAFFTELGQLLQDRRRWALFAMREDYMPTLDPYVRLLPTRLANTFRLDFLGEEAARQAIQYPSRDQGVTFTKEAADKLISDLRTVQVQQPDGTWELQPGLYVEPVQLQVVCSQLWDRLDLQSGKQEISPADLVTLGDMGKSLVDQSLAEYYADRVRKVAGETGMSERAIREWVQGELITEGGVRGLVLMGAGASKGLKNEAIWGLVASHLVRSEKRAGATWFELAHDRLIGPVREDNAQWRIKNLSLLQRQAGLWRIQGQPDSLLLRGNDLAEAQEWAAESPAEVNDSENQFLKRSQEAFQEEERARQVAERELKQKLELESAQKLVEAERKRAEEQAQYAGRLRSYLRLLIGAIALAALAVLAVIVLGAVARAQAGKVQTAAIQATEAIQLAATQVRAAEVAGATATYAYQAAATQDAAQATTVYQAGAIATSAYGTAVAQSTTAAQAGATALAVAAMATADRQQALELERRAVEASISLAASSTNNLNSQPDLALLLAVEAFNTYDTQEARAALQNGLLSKLTGETILQWSEPFVSSALSLDGSKVAWGNETGLVQVQQTENKKVVTVRNRGERPVRGLAFSRDSEVVAGVDENGVIRLWNAGLGTPLNFLLRGRPDIVTLAFNEAAVRADGSILASAGTPNRAIYLWDLKTQTNFIPDSLTISATGRRRVSALAWSEDGSQLAAGYAGGSVHVFSKDGWKETLSPEGLAGVVSALAWSPDGKQLAAGGSDPGQGNNLLLWALGSTEQPAVFFLAGHTSTVTSAAFSPDGKTLASADSAGIVRLWDPATREPAGKPLESLGAGVLSLAFSPNGNQLYAVTGRGTVIRWDLRALSKNTSPEILKELACQQAGRPGLTQVEWNSLFPTQNYRSTCGGPDAAAVPLGTPAPTPTATPAP